MPNLGCAPRTNRYVGRSVLRKRDGKPGEVMRCEETLISRTALHPFKNVYTVTFTANDEYEFVGDTSELKSFFKPVGGKW